MYVTANDLICTVYNIGTQSLYMIGSGFRFVALGNCTFSFRNLAIQRLLLTASFNRPQILSSLQAIHEAAMQAIYYTDIRSAETSSAIAENPQLHSSLFLIISQQTINNLCKKNYGYWYRVVRVIIQICTKDPVLFVMVYKRDGQNCCSVYCALHRRVQQIKMQ